jgi:hypothetical protein
MLAMSYVKLSSHLLPSSLETTSVTVCLLRRVISEITVLNKADLLSVFLQTRPVLLLIIVALSTTYTYIQGGSNMTGTICV